MTVAPLTGADLAVVVILAPLVAAAGAFVLPRAARVLALVAALGVLAGTVALAGALVAEGPIRYPVGDWQAPLGIVLYADGLTLFMLLASALTGSAVCLYAVRYFRDEPVQRRFFWPLWLSLWAALNALFLAGDVFNVYVTLELMGLSAVLLVALAGNADAVTGAMRYLLVTMLASLCYLLGVGLLYHQAATLDMELLGRVLEPAPPTWIALGLMGAALLCKSALFPLHFWLPFAHSSAPVPVSALLSALVVKATVYLLVRLWLDLLPERVPLVGTALALLGAGAILWGSVQALRQRDLKLLVAYSTVAQIGYLFLPFAIRSPDAAAVAWRGALFFLLCHALAKSAMFMAVGNMALLGGANQVGALRRIAARMPVTLFGFGLAGITLVGLPPSGGFIGKWLLLQGGFVAGTWWLTVVVLVGGLLSAAYVFRIVGLAFVEPGDSSGAGRGGYLEWVAFGLALLTIALGLAAPELLVLLDVGAPFGPSGTAPP